jgi:hypothetical protein
VVEALRREEGRVARAFWFWVGLVVGRLRVGVTPRGVVGAAGVVGSAVGLSVADGEGVGVVWSAAAAGRGGRPFTQTSTAAPTRIAKPVNATSTGRSRSLPR